MKDGVAVLLRLNRITSPIFFSLYLPPSVPSNPVSNDMQYIHILQITEEIKDYQLFNFLQLKQIIKITTKLPSGYKMSALPEKS